MLVDLVIADPRPYTFAQHAAPRILRYLSRMGIECRLIDTLHDYLYTVAAKRPDWILSFSPLTSHEKPVCDVLQIPQFYWLEGPLAPAAHFLKSQFGKIGLSDRNACQQFNPQKVSYVSHGVDLEPHETEKVFTLVGFTNLIEEVGNMRLDLFGEHVGNNLLVKLPRTVHLHPPLPYQEKLAVLKMSLMVWLDTSDPLYWPAVACGCLPVAEPRQARYYFDHPQERIQELKRLTPFLPEHTWDKQIQRIIESIP